MPAGALDFVRFLPLLLAGVFVLSVTTLGLSVCYASGVLRTPVDPYMVKYEGATAPTKGQVLAFSSLLPLLTTFLSLVDLVLYFVYFYGPAPLVYYLSVWSLAFLGWCTQAGLWVQCNGVQAEYSGAICFQRRLVLSIGQRPGYPINLSVGIADAMAVVGWTVIVVIVGVVMVAGVEWYGARPLPRRKDVKKVAEKGNV
ncbi:hypothetical protein EDC01DRAFT_660101 [Geopyxis carbonaria]|nr:hypothetical protein EDC01DRAFT_660101 [Geopyxis carbonaria]